MKLVLLGGPGSGKGTYASRLAPKYGLRHLATGDIFRDAVKGGSKLGQKVKPYLDLGNLVPDKLVNKVMKEKLKGCTNFVLDGYPRTIEQCKFLEKTASPDLVIKLQVPEEVIVARLSARRQCSQCGEIYHLRTLKPKKPGQCDKCGGKLYQREDDKPDVIRKRIKEQVEILRPIEEFYNTKEKLRSVSCKKVDVPPEKIVRKIEKLFENSKLI